ncbi:NaeI family type II restriction endonuclease [Arthrobacter sp. LFS091]|uniref:NaeI family type II restriction endonuclease n=1 Tax=Arthrobacter sp. LFS091 TaxID=3229892 RepID=UPI003A810578
MKGLIQAADPSGALCGNAIRNALDQAYDGRRTGRWDLTQLAKAETAQIGALIEVWLQRVLGLDDGISTSVQIGGYDIASTWSERIDGWTLDRPVPGEREIPYLVIWANEETSRYSLGIFRPGPDSRGVSSVDRGRPRFTQIAIDQILWVFDGCALPTNVLIKHPESAMAAVGQSSGQAAVNALFRQIQGELVHHSAVETVAQQIDSSKRIRDARKHLRREGIVILGHYRPQPEIAASLGLPSPRVGTFVSHRLAPMEAGELGTGAEIDGGRWRLAVSDDPVSLAPVLPVQGKDRS